MNSVYECFPFIWPYNAPPVLFKNSVRLRQQGRNADYAAMWIRAGSPPRTKPLASVTPKEWPQGEYAPHGCPRVLVFENLGIRGVGRDVPISRGGSAMCPVKAMQKWLNVSGVVTGGVFRRVHKTGAVGEETITGGMVGRIVQRHAASIGKDAGDFGGHSLRRGCCTAMARAGLSESQMMRVTGHRSSAQLRGYIQDAGLFSVNVSSAIGL